MSAISCVVSHQMFNNSHAIDFLYIVLQKFDIFHKMSIRRKFFDESSINCQFDRMLHLRQKVTVDKMSRKRLCLAQVNKPFFLGKLTISYIFFTMHRLPQSQSNSDH